MYEDFYQLNGKPFALSPDPRFFYASKGHSRAMAYLEYGVQREEGFIVITGEVGAGKTTLVRGLFETLGSRPLKAAQLVSTQLDAEGLLRSVCLAFGLDDVPDSKAAQLRKLEQFLLATRTRGQRALLVVDEAQNLATDAVEELRMLSNFQGDEGPLLQSFLLGQPEFRGILRSENMQQLRQRVIATYHLGPMDAADTRAYVEHRLSRVGWRQDPAFTDAAWPLIHDYSGGIPRRINTLCDRLLLMGFLEERHTLDDEQVRTVIDELEEDFGGEPDEPPPQQADPAARDRAGGDRLARVEEAIRALDQRLLRLERSTLGNLRLSSRILRAVEEPSESPVRVGHRNP